MSLISVIVPVYRVEPYLRRCVDSILNQTYSDFELILVDDGSPDACPQICDEYAQADDRVRVIHKENGGLSDARNAGFRIAVGEYITFIDSDDWVAEHFLERLLCVMQDTGCDVCECGVARVSDMAETPAQEKGRQATVYETQEALGLLIGDHILHQHVWNKMYKRACVEGVDFEVGKTNEDEFWTYQVFGRVACVAKIEDVLYAYFQRPGSIMSSGFSLKRLDALEAKCRRQAYIKEYFPQLAEAARVNLWTSCMYSAQMTLRHLMGEEQMQARCIINEILDAHHLRKINVRLFSGKMKVWALLAKGSFWTVCRLRNRLNIGF